MPVLDLKPGHRAVKAYYQDLARLSALRVSGEGAVAPAFAALLRDCAHRAGWTLVEEHPLRRGDRIVRVDGALLDDFKLVRGVWEAKDTTDDLEREVRRKFEQGYPRDNILFQAPDRLILVQDSRLVWDVDPTDPTQLIAVLHDFFGYEAPPIEQWQRAVAEFKGEVPRLAQGLFVILGNPPYNARQVNENDNNKNRKYAGIDGSVARTYSRDSAATNKNALSDVFVKAFRWASNRIIDNCEGIVAFVSNNSFMHDMAFDGMRRHLSRDFSKIYHINLKGDARTAGEQRKQEGGNIFDDTIRVGVDITLLVKKKGADGPAEVFEYSVEDYLRSEAKREILMSAEYYGSPLMPMQQLVLDQRGAWLPAGERNDFEAFLPLGTKETKAGGKATAIFRSYSRGIETTRDAWVYNFSAASLTENVERFVDTYNGGTRPSASGRSDRRHSPPAPDRPPASPRAEIIRLAPGARAGAS